MAPKIFLAHGASGSAASMQPHITGLKKRGLTAAAVQLPVGLAEKAVDRYRAQVLDLPGAIIGGQSYGGRVASLLAAQELPRGLVLLCFPLHRPGQPDGTTRIAHFKNIDCPVLLLSGESDPFARIDLLRGAVMSLRSATLVTYPGLGHSLRPVLDEALDRIGEFARTLS
ncbi:MAG: alpha/beta family hydrolase [Candidatus Limnocylindrales bacterium]